MTQNSKPPSENVSLQFFSPDTQHSVWSRLPFAVSGDPFERYFMQTQGHAIHFLLFIQMGTWSIQKGVTIDTAFYLAFSHLLHTSWRVIPGPCMRRSLTVSKTWPHCMNGPLLSQLVATEVSSMSFLLHTLLWCTSLSVVTQHVSLIHLITLRSELDVENVCTCNRDRCHFSILGDVPVYTPISRLGPCESPRFLSLLTM